MPKIKITRAQLSSETELHQNLVDWLRKVGEPEYPILRYVKHTPNEALSTGQDTRPVRQTDGTFRNVPVSVLRGAQMGVRPGVWDFEFLCPNRRPIGLIPFVEVPRPARPGTLSTAYYRGLAIEMKAADGRIDPEQVAWAEHYAANEWFTFVVYGDWAPAARLLLDWIGAPAQKGLD